MKPIRTYVLRQGHMTKAQKQALEDLWPEFGLETKQAPFDYASMFDRSAPIILEIGFGMGEALIEQAQTYPENNYLGVEVHQPGVGKTLNAIKAQQLRNIRLFNEDVHLVLDQAIADHSLAGINIFFPDPWPKKRHHKRRMINAAFIALLLCKLKFNAYLHIATDWENYAEQIAKVLETFPQLIQQTTLASRPLTKFENRGKKLGHEIFDFIFIKAANAD